MKEELLKALEELNGLIYKGLREDNPENKMVCAMRIALRMGQIKIMVEKLSVQPADEQSVSLFML